MIGWAGHSGRQFAQLSLPTDPFADPALDAVRALVEASDAAMAVFDAAGACLVANHCFVLHAARFGAAGEGGVARSGERRARFSPGGAREWTLVSVAPAADLPAASGFIDAVANALPIMFNAKDAQARYLFMNRYQAALYGVTPAEAVGKTAADLRGEAYGAVAAAIDAEVRRTGQATPFYEETLAGMDGTPRRWLTSKAPLIGPAGAVWGTATVAIDITERTRIEADLREARDAAEAGSRAKSRFLATMSHELRTPLNAVIGFADMMREEVHGSLGAPEYRDYAGLILRSGTALLDMITNLLDFARVEAGGLDLRLADVELGRLLRSVTAGARAAASAPAGAGPPLVELAPLPAGMHIRADELRLRQVVRGVIDNAVKFTPPGGRVGVSAQALPGGGAEIVVADSGIGMSPEELEHAFEPFWQADGGLGRARDGAGIGLKLARQLVALHGGSLTLESGTGQGTRVVLRFPATAP